MISPNERMWRQKDESEEEENVCISGLEEKEAREEGRGERTKLLSNIMESEGGQRCFCCFGGNM